jgi:putative FmdB family regulatory protein
MPLYEYRCAKCGKVFERLQKFSDPPVVVHEECGGLVERLISAPAFHLKGSGWYASDYPKSSPKPEGKSEESKSEGK